MAALRGFPDCLRYWTLCRAIHPFHNLLSCAPILLALCHAHGSGLHDL